MVVTSVSPSNTSADSITVEFQMSLTSKSNNTVTGTYSDAMNNDAEISGNYLAPNLTNFARAIEGQYKFVGPLDDDQDPFTWEGTMTATSSAGNDVFLAPFTATKAVDWSEYAGDYELPAVSVSAPGGFTILLKNMTYTWAVAIDGSLRVATDMASDQFSSSWVGGCFR